MYTYIYVYVCIHICYTCVCVKYVSICTGCCMRSQWTGRLLNFEIPAIMESYGMAWYILHFVIMSNYIVCFVFYHYWVDFKLFTRSYNFVQSLTALKNS